MARRTMVSQQRHDAMVQRIADGLRDGGFPTVRADQVDGYAPPDEIGGQVPDVTASGQQEYIYEVETEESLELDETDRQWQAFAHYARHNNAQFVIVVPKGLGIKAKARKNFHQLRAEVREEDFPPLSG